MSSSSKANQTSRELREKILTETFAITPDMMEKVTSDKDGLSASGDPIDGMNVREFGKALLDRYDALPKDAQKRVDAVWAQWLAAAKEAGVTLPYSTPAQRFMGGYPTYISESPNGVRAPELAVIKHALLKDKPLPADRTAPSTLHLYVTLGPPGAGKSTLLMKIITAKPPLAVPSSSPEGTLEDSANVVSLEAHRDALSNPAENGLENPENAAAKNVATPTPRGAVLSDPDEGILENFGPYLFARAIWKESIEQKNGGVYSTNPEEAIRQRNEWRLPAYNLFRGSSIVMNTLVTLDFVRAGYDIAFGWTGAGAYGLNLVKNGYKRLGYKIDMIMEVTDLENRLEREARRQRPATPEDFISKASGFLAMLPETLPLADRFRLYNGNPQEPALAFDTLEKGAEPYISVEHVLHVLNTLRMEADNAGEAKRGVQTGIDLLRHKIGGALL